MVAATPAAQARTEIDDELGMAAEAVRKRAPSAADSDDRLSLRVCWVGPRRAWLELEEAKAEPDGVELQYIGVRQRPPTSPHVVHLARSALGEVEHLRKTLTGSRFVLDLTGEGETSLTRVQARRAGKVDAVLAGSRWSSPSCAAASPDGRRTRPSSAVPSTSSGTRPSRRSRRPRVAGRDLRRFRRFHRLAGPVILFAGPYVEAGGFDLLLEVAYRLREKMPELRVTAIPHGPTDPPLPGPL